MADVYSNSIGLVDEHSSSKVGPTITAVAPGRLHLSEATMSAMTMSNKRRQRNANKGSKSKGMHKAKVVEAGPSCFDEMAAKVETPDEEKMPPEPKWLKPQPTAKADMAQSVRLPCGRFEEADASAPAAVIAKAPPSLAAPPPGLAAPSAAPYSSNAPQNSGSATEHAPAELESEAYGLLDDEWWDRCGSVGTVRGDTLHLAHDGSSNATCIKFDWNTMQVQMCLFGEVMKGVLSSDSFQILWSAGDQWYRREFDVRVFL